MLKGKVINNQVNSTNELKSTKIINNKPNNIQSDLQPSKIINTTNITTTQVESNTIKEKTLLMSVNYLEQKIPNYNRFFYLEVYEFLKTLDVNLNEDNITINLNKFYSLVDNIHQKVQRICEIRCSPLNTFSKLKEEFRNNNTFLGFIKDISTEDVERFNNKVNVLYSNLSTEIDEFMTSKETKLKHLDRLYFYYDFLKLIAVEIVNRNICSFELIKTTPLSGRISQIHNSLLVIEQYKQTIQYEITSKQSELNNVKEYLFTLKPSLDLLKHSNVSEFKKVFKEFLR